MIAVPNNARILVGQCPVDSRAYVEPAIMRDPPPPPTSTRQSGQHWRIENRNHHVRDVTMGEDDRRIRVQPGPSTRIRIFALNIFRADGARNTAQVR